MLVVPRFDQTDTRLPELQRRPGRTGARIALRSACSGATVTRSSAAASDRPAMTYRAPAICTGGTLLATRGSAAERVVLRRIDDQEWAGSDDSAGRLAQSPPAAGSSLNPRPGRAVERGRINH